MASFPHTNVDVPLYYYVAVDFALTEEAQNDATAIQPFALDHKENIYFDEPVHGRWESHDAIEKTLDAVEACGAQMLFMEKGPIWRAIKPQLEKRIAERGIMVTVVPVSQAGDKRLKARVLQARMQQGRVFFRHCVFFEETWLTEFLRFLSGGKHDDLVDAASLAAFCVQEAIAAPPPEVEDDPEENADHPDNYDNMMKRVNVFKTGNRRHVPAHINGTERSRRER